MKDSVGFSSTYRDTLPEPLDPKVHLRKEEGQLIATLRYSGDWSEKRFREKETAPFHDERRFIFL
jgi:hypothetical protein